MTIRKRIKKRWHFRLGEFEFKKATYNSDKTRTFEVWYKYDLVGTCESKYFYHAKHNLSNVVYSELPKFLLKVNDLGYLDINEEFKKNTVGRVFFKGIKNQFPEEILYVDMFPLNLTGNLEMASKRQIIVEKIKSK